MSPGRPEPRAASCGGPYGRTDAVGGHMRLIERLRSEYAYLSGAARILRRVTPIARNKTRTFPDILEDLESRFGDRVALLNEHESLTYRELFARANRYARWALAQGVGKGDTVALLMHNRPEYLAAGWAWSGSAAWWRCSTPISPAARSPTASTSRRPADDRRRRPSPGPRQRPRPSGHAAAHLGRRARQGEPRGSSRYWMPCPAMRLPASSARR
jgi:hypothetical protein